MSFRGFIAAEVGSQPTVEAFQEELRATGADLKLVPPENLHVTLKFLGDTPEERVPEILEALERAAAPAAPGRLELRGAGAFPKPAAPRVVWVGVGDGADTLTGVAERLEDALEPLGFPRERRDFHPHVTVARTRGPRNQAALTDAVRRHEGEGFGEAPLERVVLMRSTLRPQGPRYDVVDAAPLEA